VHSHCELISRLPMVRPVSRSALGRLWGLTDAEIGPGRIVGGYEAGRNGELGGVLCLLPVWLPLVRL
jgi:hypothetical protein